ncbi:MAG TPA: DPP IV N-terminal domain-containing protein [Bacteroidales bacterium]|nr:DPP IV N-terminal domain-containing protein [Bacteroidales bacterium]
MKRNLVIFFLFFAASVTHGQKADFKAAEKFQSDNMKTKYGDLRISANWINESNKFWYSYKRSDGKNFFYVNADTRTKSLMFDRRFMASEINKLIHRPFNELDLPLEDIEFEKNSTTRFTFKIDSIRFSYDINSKIVAIKDTVPKKDRDPGWATYSPDSTWIAYAKNHNLFLMKTNDPDSVEIQLSTDGELYWGYEGRRSDTTKDKKVRSGARWFKNSEKLYITKSDSRKVSDLFVINSLADPRPELETYKYAMPGEENVPQLELIVFDVESRERIDADIKKWKDQRLQVKWTSQESADKMVILRKKRDLTEQEVCMVNANTGETEVLFGEELYPYIYDNYGYGQLSVLNEGKDIIWWSERSGWGQLFLYDDNGNMKRQITDGYFVTGSIQGIDTLNRELYIEGFGRENGIHPYYTMIYRVSIDRPGMKLLTSEDATHSFSMSKTNNYWVDTYSRVDLVPKSVLRDNNGNVILNLEEADLTQVYATGWKMPERIVVKAKDGVTDLYGVMVKPFDFDSTKKYPVISYVYPGPQTESVPYSFSVNNRYTTALAQLGFIVVNFGHRGGSPQRNHYYHTYGYDNLRDYALADDRYGIEQLADKYNFIDVDRVGIYGHSGGGFMSTAALLSHPDFYDVAVSSSGNHDNNIYNQWWGETHHGVTEVEKSSTNNSSAGTRGRGRRGDPLQEQDTVKKEEKVITFESNIPNNQDIARNLKGHLLLVHGDIDNNVHPGNSIRVVDALIKANKRFDFMIMPGQSHSYGPYSAYFERMMWYYFAEHLLDDYRTNVGLMDF